MWIVTDKGFFSFVVDRKDPNYLWLRARVREDLARNFPDAEIIEKPGADYLFRAKVLRTEVAARMSQMIMEADITGHFKDVANRRSAQPTHGNRSSAYYAFWTAMAALQPYAPYSKTPRPKAKPWTPPKRGPGAGQTSLPMFSNGGGTGRYDWSANPWSDSYAGHAQADPPLGAPVDIGELADVDSAGIVQRLIDAGSEEEFDEIWAAMTDAEREAYLDTEEETLRRREETEEEFGAAARTLELHQGPDSWITCPDDSSHYPAPRLTRSQRRAKAREEKPDLSTLEGRNRQAYLDKQAKRRGKGRKNRHNQQG